MEYREEIDQLKKEMAQCRNNVYVEIESIKEQLAAHSEQRETFNKAITEKMDAVIERFNSHDDEEMKKYDEIIDKLGNLVDAIETITVKTEDNTDFIETIKKYWGRATVAVATAGTILGGLYWLYIFLQKHGMVIVFEKAM